mmetsp:Transcript_112191/g.312251  ORF Transcript_112191/g.312251 Transcript_112191/m.312251 type:complete len:403 (-) Transcript_112191:130-1338(-)
MASMRFAGLCSCCSRTGGGAANAAAAAAGELPPQACKRLLRLAAHAVPPEAVWQPLPVASGPLPLLPSPAAGVDGGLPVNTVLGAVSSQQLGMVLPHEHCFVSSAGMTHVYPERVPMDYVVPEAIAALRQLKEAGGSTIVDCTTYDLGRDIRVMAQIAEESGINIIATTGSWIDPPRSFHFLRPRDLAELYIREAVVGIEGTSIKAGIIKCAHETGTTWEKGTGFTAVGETTCRAAAIAQKVTGLPITTHTEVEERVGLAQIKIFEEEGVDLNRVYIGHCNDSTDIDYLTEMLRKGVWLGLDRTGPGSEPGSSRPDWEGRTLTIKQLIDAGWGHRIMLSHDWMVYLGFVPAKVAKRMRAGNPDGYTFIMRKVIPRLHELGVSTKQTDAILYDNPRRFFGNVK